MKKFLIAAVIALALVMPALGLGTKAVSADMPVYESFDDYDTAYDRRGREGNVYQQIIDWTDSPATFIAEAGNPVGSASGKSLKLSQRSNTAIVAWSNGTKDAAKLNQTGAKYVKFHVRNLSSEAREIGVMLTDILQSTIDGFASAGNTIPDAGQEHWTLKWNKSVMLETTDGQKSTVKSVNGNTFEIPRDFVGSVSIPLEADNLCNPDWWLAEGHTYGNGKLDLDKLFMVSFCFPEATNIDSEVADSWSVFEFDNVSFGFDDSVAEYLDSSQGGTNVKEEEVIRPSSSKVSVDFAERTITVPKGTVKSVFDGYFSLPSGYTLTVKDEFGFAVSSDTAEIKDNSAAVFSDGENSFQYTVKVSDTGATGGKSCGSALTGGVPLMAAVVGAGFILLKKRGAAK